MDAKIRRTESLTEEAVGAGEGTRKQDLTGRGEGAGFHMRRFVMEPGGGMPRHTNRVEHQQYVLRGRATIGIGDETVTVEEGTVLHIPAGVPHWYRAEEGEPFEFLCVVPDDEDRIEILDDGDD